LNAERAMAVAAAAPALGWSLAGAGQRLAQPVVDDFTGRPVGELRGDGWTRVVHTRGPGACLGIRATSFEAQSPFTLDLRLRRHDGDNRWFVDNGAVPARRRRRPAGFVGSAIEIHERKMLEETLAERTQALRLAERRQGQFLAMLSHELRNPLAPIAKRRQRAAHPRAQQPDPGPPARDPRAPGRPARPAGGGADRTSPAPPRARSRWCASTVHGTASSRRRSASSHDKLNAGRHRLEVDVPDERLYVRGDPGRLARRWPT
jgi:hypothetical protein